MYKVINDGKNSVVFFTSDEADKYAYCRQVDEETIKDDKKLQEILDKKDYVRCRVESNIDITNFIILTIVSLLLLVGGYIYFFN